MASTLTLIAALMLGSTTPQPPAPAGAEVASPRVRALHAEPLMDILPEGAAGPVLPFVPLRVDERAWKAIEGHDTAWIDAVPLSDGDAVDLRLSRLDPFARDARIVVVEAGPDGGPVERALALPEVSAWAGTVAGRPGSRAFIARSAAGLQGYIQFDGRTEVISSGPAGAAGAPMVADAAALPPGEFSCGGGLPPPIGAEPPRAMPQGQALVAACRQLPLAFETATARHDSARATPRSRHAPQTRCSR